MKICTNIMLAAMVLTLVFGCSEKSSSSNQVPASNLNDYVIEVSGTRGLQLDVLLISKPTLDSIERESACITVPYRKELKAFKCVAWIDGRFDDIEGDFRMTLTVNNNVGSVVDGRVQQGHETSGLAHDL